MNQSATLEMWWVISTALMGLVPIGLLLFESGLVPERHMAGVAIKRLLMFLAALASFSLVGVFFLPEIEAQQYSYSAWLLCQMGYATVAAAIVSGAMSGRTTLTANIIAAAFVGGILYPVHAGWLHRGWLNTIGVHDFAGSGAVHLLGGLVGLVGAVVAGPRVEVTLAGPYPSSEQSTRAVPVAACGVFLLWIGWLGLNWAGLQSPDQLALVARIAVSTGLAAAGGALATMAVAGSVRSFRRYGGIFDASAVLCGALGGLVASSACCDILATRAPVVSFMLGGLAGVVAYVLNRFARSVLRVDDTVGATGVHVGGGIVGLAFAGFLGVPSWPQLVNIAVLITFATVPAWLVFQLLLRTSLLESSFVNQRIGLTFDSASSAREESPIRIRYLPRDLQEQARDFIVSLTSVPIHALRSVASLAKSVLDELRMSRQGGAALSGDAKALVEQLERLAPRLQSTTSLMRTMAEGGSTPIDLAAISDALVAGEYSARYKGAVSVEFRSEATRTMVHGDPVLTPEAIRAVVGNAIFACLERLESRREAEYSPSVHVSIEAADDAKSPFVYLSVRDNGLGVPEEARRNLGQPFTSVRYLRSGSGLGLFFANHVMKVVGGELHYCKDARTDGETEFRLAFRRTRDLELVHDA